LNKMKNFVGIVQKSPWKKWCFELCFSEKWKILCWFCRKIFSKNESLWFYLAHMMVCAQALNKMKNFVGILQKSPWKKWCFELCLSEKWKILCWFCRKAFSKNEALWFFCFVHSFWVKFKVSWRLCKNIF